MEANERKPKRPRIGEQRPTSDQPSGNDYSQNASESPREDRGYNSYNHSQGGYQRNYNQGGYRQNNYNQGGYQQRYNNYGNQEGSISDDGAEGDNAQGEQQNGYNNYRNQGGYQQRGGQGGYHQQGGYQQRGGQGGYHQQGGYQQRGGQQGGYQQRGGQGGYQQRGGQQGGYQQRGGQGGYQQRGNQQGGYQQRGNQQGGYQQRGGQQGGYQQRGGQGGYQQRGNQQGGYQQRGGNQQRGFQQGGRQPQGFNRPGKTFVARPKRVEYEFPAPDPNSTMRLNKFMANAGLCSRREADEFIQQGLVKVNGNVVTELGTKITPQDVVEFKDQVVTLEKKCYILLNKPKDCVTTSDDPNGRLTVMDLVKGACPERIYPVGRLDRNTTGVLLLTNDGDLASKLTHPQYVKKKIYHVWCDKDIAEDDMQRIADGIELEDGEIHADAISYATETDRNQAGIEIHSGRNRIVRRIFESLGYHVTKLDRVYFAGLTKKNLPRGRWRYLTQEEVNFLKMNSFE